LGLQLRNPYASIPFNSYRGYDLATKAIGAIIPIQQIAFDVVVVANKKIVIVTFAA
jgi:hypothetical protein